ncbi:MULTISPECIES: hypothetical protein [Streptomyces]|uniref:hypothetical protein n=1 Tax=Streptomyces TaxID=1883 RepID=UPI001E4371CD|nr:MULTISPECIES: hypothetical protein [Streptomyces]UFQ16385.1 hypothetical protein J2N69_16020 [Streptomyces huasconensis]WCL85988.1 hypothetical protein PPN52_16030 [Streptomyces sp. JCM 35825]
MTEIREHRGVLYPEATARPTISRHGERTVTVEATFRQEPDYSTTEVLHLSRAAALALIRDTAKALDAHLADTVTQYLAEE